MSHFPRMYEHDFPSVGEIVMCKIVEVAEIGSYVQLLEFENIIGMISVSDYSRQRIRNVTKFMNVGKVLPAQVIRVDINKKFIDLSKTTLSLQEFSQAENKYKKSKRVELICRKVAQKLLTSEGVEASKENVYNKMLYVYQTMIWPTTNTTNSTQKVEADDKMKELSKVFISNETNEMNKEQKCLIQTCKDVYKVGKLTITGICSFVYFGAEGVDKIKEILMALKQEYNLQIQYFTPTGLSASQYKFIKQSSEREDEGMCVQKINECMDKAVRMFNTLLGGQGNIVEKASYKEEVEENDNESCEDN